MKKILIYIFLAVNIMSVFGQSKEADWLTEKSSDAIILNDQTDFYISGSSELKVERAYEVIIKNKYAKDYSNIEIYYDKFQKVENAEVLVYDLAGKVVDSYKMKDFDDMAYGISSTASDGRVKYLKINYSKYPYRIKVQYARQKKGSLHYPIWYPQPSDRLRLISAQFNIYDYTGNSLRYDNINVSEPEVTSLDKGKKYTWRIKDIEPFEYEYLNDNLKHYAPIVYTAPNSFTMDNHNGEMNNWSSFGQWINKLNEGKNDLNPDDLSELDQKVSESKSIEEKVSVVYKYLQQNTRYVSIQLGIGGWQPFNASLVQEKKYGDCKALSFYTKSLLENYDIDSYYTLINAGSNARDMDKSFPNAHFNHAILTVPIKTDTIFLECTSQTKPFGYMGTFTSDRSALLIDEKGGHLIRTKRYDAGENLQSTNALVNLDKEGNAQVELTRKYEGLEIDNHNFRGLYHDSKNEYKKWFLDNHSFGNISVSSFELDKLQDGSVPVGAFKVDFSSGREAIKTGGRLFLQPGKYSNTYISRLSKKERKTPIHIRYGYSQVDTVTINPPVNYVIEKLLKERSLDSRFGHYERNIINNEGQLIYVRKFILNTGLYPAEDYEGFRDFIYKIKKWDKEKVVLVDKT